MLSVRLRHPFTPTPSLQIYPSFRCCMLPPASHHSGALHRVGGFVWLLPHATTTAILSIFTIPAYPHGSSQNPQLRRHPAVPSVLAVGTHAFHSRSYPRILNCIPPMNRQFSPCSTRLGACRFGLSLQSTTVAMNILMILFICRGVGQPVPVMEQQEADVGVGGSTNVQVGRRKKLDDSRGGAKDQKAKIKASERW
ncbi:unnamed protein product [Linum tenue]|uniref:Uncharacterized protein n=1 Tax=Linum tenue TaxID=586396 RepID=A0AAV0IIU2_9ROSI|nr:unnamed protein product [Linum tenue]